MARIALMLFVMFAVAGCGQSGPRLVHVSGNVTLAGKPLETGRVIFESTDPNAASEAGLIKDGKYEFDVQPGGKRVKIHSIRDVPGTEGKGMMGEPIREDIVPAVYNTKTTLEITVKSDGPNRFDFELK